MLFDRDEDGVLSFQELQVVMKSMGQRPSGGVKRKLNIHFLMKIFLPSEEELLEKVRDVSEDYLYNTVEFNEGGFYSLRILMIFRFNLNESIPSLSK